MAPEEKMRRKNPKRGKGQGVFLIYREGNLEKKHTMH